jgi:hypothetical protein
MDSAWIFASPTMQGTALLADNLMKRYIKDGTGALETREQSNHTRRAHAGDKLAQTRDSSKVMKMMIPNLSERRASYTLKLLDKVLLDRY